MLFPLFVLERDNGNDSLTKCSLEPVVLIGCKDHSTTAPIVPEIFQVSRKKGKRKKRKRDEERKAKIREIDDCYVKESTKASMLCVNSGTYSPQLPE